MTPEEALALLLAWRDTAQDVVLHIAFCATCFAAERSGGTMRYCDDGERLWGREMSYEYKVIEALPELKAMGVEPDDGFKFWSQKGPQQ